MPPAAGLTVVVSSQASAGLRMRLHPNGSADTVKVLAPGTLLTVLEISSVVQTKIGVIDQWLNVKEPGGLSGYVAAWYVQ